MTNVRRQRMSCGASGLSIVGPLWLMVDTNSAQQHDEDRTRKISPTLERVLFLFAVKVRGTTINTVAQRSPRSPLAWGAFAA